MRGPLKIPASPTPISTPTPTHTPTPTLTLTLTPAPTPTPGLSPWAPVAYSIPAMLEQIVTRLCYKHIVYSSNPYIIMIIVVINIIQRIHILLLIIITRFSGANKHLLVMFNIFRSQATNYLLVMFNIFLVYSSVSSIRHVFIFISLFRYFDILLVMFNIFYV